VVHSLKGIGNTSEVFHEELLSSLFGRINRKAIEILQVELSESEKYRDLYHHILDADKIVANVLTTGDVQI